MAKNKKNNLSFFMIAFLALAFIFLALGLGTLGSVKGTGKAYELYASGKDKDNFSVVFKLSDIVEKDENGAETSRKNLRIKDCYVNIAVLYSEEGEDVTMILRRGGSNNPTSTSTNYQYKTTIENLVAPAPAEAEEGKEPPARTAVTDAVFNWVTPFSELFQKGDDYNRVRSYEYYKLFAESHNVLINEVVFVGEVLKANSKTETTGELVVIPATIESATPLNTESPAEAQERAGALLDAQFIPSTAQSSFFRFGQEEVYSMMTVAEMREGNPINGSNVYHGDTVYNSFGTSLLAFGTVMFGMSPFGLRFFPMLASFGVLVLTFFLAKAMFGSDKAGFAGALLYALCNFSFGLGHLGTPLMIGVFFAVAALLCAYRFFAFGIEKVSALETLPLVLGGLCGAAAICVNGAFVLPVAGIAGLFVAGLVRLQKQRAVALEPAIAAYEEELASLPPQEEGTEEPPAPAKEALQGILHDYRRKSTVAPAAFFTSLIVGAMLLSLLFVLPIHLTASKLYRLSGASVFTLAGKLFAGGFAGTAHDGNVWAIPYTVFRGTGEHYAITLLVMNAVAALAGLFGIGFAVYRIVAVLQGKGEKSELARVTVPLASLAISLVLAAFARGTFAFFLIAYLSAFLLAGGGAEYFTAKEGKIGKAARIVSFVAAVLLAVCFLLAVPFTFSVPVC